MMLQQAMLGGMPPSASERRVARNRVNQLCLESGFDRMVYVLYVPKTARPVRFRLGPFVQDK